MQAAFVDLGADPCRDPRPWSYRIDQIQTRRNVAVMSRSQANAIVCRGEGSHTVDGGPGEASSQLHTRAVLRDPTNVLSLGPFAVKAYVVAPGDLVRAQPGNRLRSVPVIL